jgi:protein-disulfide isomerase
MRLKHNSEIFEGLLVRQREVTQVPEGLGITLGNPQALHTVIKVCNPYCGPCAKAHPLLEELLNENENVLVKIIFMATNEEHNRRAKPVRHLMAISEKNDQRLIKKALDDWYLPEEKDYEVFAAKYPMNGELDRQNEKLAAMEAWCKESQILHTPTIFVDGHELPDLYAIGDLKDILS